MAWKTTIRPGPKVFFCRKPNLAFQMWTRIHVQKKWLVKVYTGHGYFCQLCGKGTWHNPDCTHLKSTQHLEKETEEIWMNRFFGTSAGRRLGEGCQSPTKAAIRTYWGDNVENLITILETKLRQDGRAILVEMILFGIATS